MGVQNVGTDWNVQAALSAESYLDYSSFSEGGLRDQLDYEDKTPGADPLPGVLPLVDRWAQRDSNPRHLPCKGSALAN
jgi:hypothetical protein